MDIDIDFADKEKILALIKHTPAMQVVDGVEQKHISGVYVSDIPVNPLTGNASIDYEEAEKRGYFKIDFLNMGIYDSIQSEEELDILLKEKPDWDKLLDKKFCDKLVHLNGHHEVVKTMRPRSIEQLAMVLAMIRPAKRYLIGMPWDKIREEVWKKPEDGSYYFKHSHSIAYAHLVVLHMNFLCLMQT